MTSVRRSLAGALVALAGTAALCAVMLALRPHLSIATAGLVLVVPVVAGVAVGGLTAGIVSVAIGFFAYDLFFIPPYNTLTVGSGQDWVALIVYVIVMLAVARVVVTLQQARAEARRREEETNQVYVLSDLLIGDQPLDVLLKRIVSTIDQAFHPRWVAVLLPAGDSLAVAATAGAPLSDDELGDLSPLPGRLESLDTGRDQVGIVQFALTARGRPVGLVALSGAGSDPHDRQLFRTYANHAALAIERSQLQRQVRRTELLEEVDRWRAAMMGAVSHDLRTPLASVKAAVSTLRRSGPPLSTADQAELLELIESQSDNLDRLVADLLDMTRIQSGALELRRDEVRVSDLVEGAVRSVAHKVATDQITTTLPPDLPTVDVDQVLMVQVLANLLENAARHSPPAQPIEIVASTHDGVVEVTVRDHGPGIPIADRERIFEMFNQVSGGGRGGLGLTIARAFVEAHGQAISLGDTPEGGAAFVFTMPRASLPADGR
jgi:two-component system sensor histidine kinase KdpD